MKKYWNFLEFKSRIIQDYEGPTWFLIHVYSLYVSIIGADSLNLLDFIAQEKRLKLS